MDNLRCRKCLFCDGVEMERGLIRCTNADVAVEANWEELYFTQGYLELPLPGPEDKPCFWFVRRA